MVTIDSKTEGYDENGFNLVNDFFSSLRDIYYLENFIFSSNFKVDTIWIIFSLVFLWQFENALIFRIYLRIVYFLLFWVAFYLIVLGFYGLFDYLCYNNDSFSIVISGYNRFMTIKVIAYFS